MHCAVTDPDTAGLISDTEVAETSYTSFSGQVTPCLIVRRVKNANYPDFSGSRLPGCVREPARGGLT